MYNHSPKCQSLNSLLIKVMFFPKYATNGLHGVGGKLAYLMQNCRLLEHILLWVLHWICSPILSKLLNPVTNSAFWWSMTALILRKLACTTLYELLAKQASTQNAFSLVDQDMVGKTIVAIFYALSLLLQPEKERN